MAKRKALRNSVRFEVFKRDRFTCQFCGRKAPEVVLQVDHLKPVSKGGGNDILNLITSCVECNSGKSNQPLSDSALLDKTRRQLEDMEERRQQLQMMVQWRESLTKAKDTLVESIEKQLFEASGLRLNDLGRTKVRSLLAQFSFDEVCDAIPIAADQYFERRNGKVTDDSFSRGFSKIGGICKGRRLERENPDQAQLIFALNIWKKVSGYPTSYAVSQAFDAIRDAYAKGKSIADIKRACANSRGLNRLLGDLSGDA